MSTLEVNRAVTKLRELEHASRQEFVSQMAELIRHGASGVAAEELADLLQGRPWTENDGVQLSAGGAGQIQFKIPAGYRVELTRIAVSVSGASAAATVAVYEASSAAQQDESELIDFAAQLFGNNPSRNISPNTEPVDLGPNKFLTIVIAGAAASAQASARVKGRKFPVRRTGRADY